MRDNFLVAWIGLLGVVVGAVVSAVGTIVRDYLQERANAKRDEPRRRLLRTMLLDPRFEWRSLDTLAHVIGADSEATTTLLIQIGARASEDGKDLWGLIKKHPLPSKQ